MNDLPDPEEDIPASRPRTGRWVWVLVGLFLVYLCLTLGGTAFWPSDQKATFSRIGSGVESRPTPER